MLIDITFGVLKLLKSSDINSEHDSNTLSKLYENHTMAEIAEMYGVSRSTVNFWIWKYRKEEEAAAEAAEQETVQEDV